MKRFVFLAVSAAFLISGISAFAYGRPSVSAYTTTQNLSIPTVAVSMSQPVASTQDWVGKNGDQLFLELGVPNYSYVANNGDNVYAYIEHGAQRGRNDTPRLHRSVRDRLQR